MNCTRVPLPGGGFAIVCSGRARPRARCRWCPAAPGPFQCDWKTGPRATCDKHLCEAHAFEVGPNRHLCPAHVLAYRAWLRELGIPLG